MSIVKRFPFLFLVLFNLFINLPRTVFSNPAQQETHVHLDPARSRNRNPLYTQRPPMPEPDRSHVSQHDIYI